MNNEVVNAWKSPMVSEAEWRSNLRRLDPDGAALMQDVKPEFEDLWEAVQSNDNKRLHAAYQDYQEAAQRALINF